MICLKYLLRVNIVLLMGIGTLVTVVPQNLNIAKRSYSRDKTFLVMKFAHIAVMGV